MICVKQRRYCLNTSSKRRMLIGPRLGIGHYILLNAIWCDHLLRSFQHLSNRGNVHSRSGGSEAGLRGAKGKHLWQRGRRGRRLLANYTDQPNLVHTPRWDHHSRQVLPWVEDQQNHKCRRRPQTTSMDSMQMKVMFGTERLSD